MRTPHVRRPRTACREDCRRDGRGPSRPNTPHVFRFSMLLILGGAIGNLFDRLAFGYVRDFICYDFLYSMFDINFAVGNVADIYLVLGVFVLIIYIFFGYKEGDFSKSRGTLLSGGANAD